MPPCCRKSRRSPDVDSAERLQVIHDPFSKAYARRLRDWKEATSQAQADAVSRNLNRLEESYLRAAKQALDANGAAVEAAYSEARSAQEAVDDAYRTRKRSRSASGW